jgi:glutamate N-acetyltransferase/amino-acid N-acetyltransferase
MKDFVTIQGAVTAAKGFQAAAISAGIRYSRDDMAMIVSDRPAVVAGTFTTNKVCAAPVKVCRDHLKGRQARAIVINAGCANACTGKLGMQNAKTMARKTALALGVPEKTVFPCSTGTIGLQLPMDKIEAGIKMAAKALSHDAGPRAAKAIMTTDTVDKQCALEFRIDGVPVRIGGMAKGAGMIEPNMATMLSFVTTDAAVDPKALQACLSAAVAESFNRISVDGDMSTNDTVLLMANGAAGNKRLGPGHKQWKTFVTAVNTVTKELALKIVKDGEGATKFVTITVKGAANTADARKAVRAVANSLLVKTSWFGGDPNWGRVIDAVGYSGAKVNEERVDISYEGISAVKNGMKAPNFALKDLERVLKQKCFRIDIDLHLGKGTDTVYTCDCSFDYVKINSEYMT